MKKNINQSGFGAAGIILIILAVLVIGFVGVQVASNQGSSKNSSASNGASAPSSKTYTDDSQSYSFAYNSSGWQLTTTSTHNGPANVTYLDNQDPWLNPSNGNYTGSGITALGYKATGNLNNDLADALRDPAGTDEKAQTVTINGYSGIYKQVSNSDYTDDMYIVTNDKNSVYFIFREKMSETDTSDGKSVTKTIDDTKYVPDFKAVVNSVKFLK